MLTDRVEKLLRSREDVPSYTSQIVIDELVYISVAKYFKDRELEGDRA